MAALGDSTLIRLLYFFYFADICGLMSLTYVQSNEFFPFHAFSFGCFLASSNLFMISALLVTGGRDPKLKKLFIAHASSLSLAMFCYWKHNAACQDLVYTFFALFEYGVVFSNIAFHYHFGNIFGASILSVQAHQSGYTSLLPS